MKRSPLKRKTPLKRSGQLKRTAIKRTRPKTSPEREKYRRKFKQCQNCGEPRKHIHELVTRGQSSKAVEYRCCFLALCEDCHNEIHRTSEWPIERQLALKQRVDPEGYDLAKVNELRGRGPNAITQEEVDEWRILDKQRVVPIESVLRSVGRESHRPGRKLAIRSVAHAAARDLDGRKSQETTTAMSQAEDTRALIRHLELKAESQRRNLDRTLDELAIQKRKLDALNRKDKLA